MVKNIFKATDLIIAFKKKYKKWIKLYKHIYTSFMCL